MDLDVLSAFTIFDPQKLLGVEEGCFTTYGNSNIDVLANHFNETINKEAVSQNLGNLLCQSLHSWHKSSVGVSFTRGSS